MSIVSKKLLTFAIETLRTMLFTAGEPRKFIRQGEYAISFTEKSSVWTIAYSIATAFLGPTS